MAKNMLVRAKILKVNTDVQPVTPCTKFFTKNNLRVQKVRVGVSLCVRLTSLHYFL